jgi:hypothetical protein
MKILPQSIRSRHLLLLLIATVSVGTFLVTVLIAAFPCGMTYCERLLSRPYPTTLIDRQGAELSLKAFSNSPFGYLTEPVRWQPSGVYQGRYQEIIVPRGFVTGLASVPPIFWAIYQPSDLGPYLRMARAAVIHDYLYWTQIRPRAVADEILKIQMAEIGLSSFNVQRIYWAVRLFGGKAWKENKGRREVGEKRLLVKLPTAETDWIEWRRHKDVFVD